MRIWYRFSPQTAAGSKTRLHAIADGQVRVATPPGLDLSALGEAPNGPEETFGLSLAPDTTVLKRERKTNVFAVVKYSLP